MAYALITYQKISSDDEYVTNCYTTDSATTPLTESAAISAGKQLEAQQGSDSPGPMPNYFDADLPFGYLVLPVSALSFVPS